MRNLRNEAHAKICFHQISVIGLENLPVIERVECRATIVDRDAALAAGTIRVPFEDDAKLERILSNLLWTWADSKFDSQSFMRCDDNTINIGTHMWTVIT